MAFHEKLMELRRARGLSQEELGYRLDVTRQTVSKWELGQTTPEMDKLIELSRIFDLSIDELVGNKTETTKSEQFVLSTRPLNYEYKSKRTLFGLPLVHINVGMGMRRAKGIIAIGTIAKGIVAFGGVSVGVISFGAVSLGLIALGALGLGIVASGAVAVGALAFGGIAFGIVAFGGLSFGVYALGGYASALRIAMGGYARGHIAIGDAAHGDLVWNNINELTKADYAAIKDAILQSYPRIWRWLLNIFTAG
jgi:transcriptional regulator with XRE-family HTH domain